MVWGCCIGTWQRRLAPGKCRQRDRLPSPAPACCCEPPVNGESIPRAHGRDNSATQAYASSLGNPPRARTGFAPTSNNAVCKRQSPARTGGVGWSVETCARNRYWQSPARTGGMITPPANHEAQLAIPRAHGRDGWRASSVSVSCGDPPRARVGTAPARRSAVLKRQSPARTGGITQQPKHTPETPAIPRAHGRESLYTSFPLKYKPSFWRCALHNDRREAVCAQSGLVPAAAGDCCGRATSSAAKCYHSLAMTEGRSVGMGNPACKQASLRHYSLAMTGWRSLAQ